MTGALILSFISTCTGAGAVILSQFVSNRLKDKSDLKKLKFDLIAEERRLAYMLLLNQTGYIKSGITMEYYYQLSNIEPKVKDQESSLERYHEEIKVSNSLHARYSLLIGDYCKNIYQLSLYIENCDELEIIIQKIINHTHQDFTDLFEHINNYPDLYEAYSNEHNDVSKKMQVYKSYYDQIRQIITQIINRKS
ncbi:hypothetical protein J0383_19665 [Flavobacterium endoglycinae]|uniref:DUF4760 domain-containing protein n=1 Tax=Flavobacterium endoglycinae TaxID=2816357 RepID=A0ABX7QCR8_9FLAO|nr:hypothetical protein [Flavobacterium endoglycinae]QSW88454.1 hypothetical protein J0383_19665 [Flavobacterium endoglycinae]